MPGSEESWEAAEMIDFGGGWTTAVTEFDGVEIGGGVAGPVQRGLEQLLLEDMRSPEHTDLVPF